MATASDPANDTHTNGASVALAAGAAGSLAPVPVPPTTAAESNHFPGSLLCPSWLRALLDPSIKTVMMAGCGGGFDFVHSMTIYPELRRLGKTVIINSFSFGSPHAFEDAPVVWPPDAMGLQPDVVKRVNGASKCNNRYCPEVRMASFLDLRYPETAPHSVYACNARTFTVRSLRAWYEQLCTMHNVDAVVLVDGGTDSLMDGTEAGGLGDPLEDCVSVSAVATLKNEHVRVRLLLAVGMGSDRYNDVSDAASLRAVAELTAQGGFRGAISLEPQYAGLMFYRDCVKHVRLC